MLYVHPKALATRQRQLKDPVNARYLEGVTVSPVSVVNYVTAICPSATNKFDRDRSSGSNEVEVNSKGFWCSKTRKDCAAQLVSQEYQHDVRSTWVTRKTKLRIGLSDQQVASVPTVDLGLINNVPHRGSLRSTTAYRSSQDGLAVALVLHDEAGQTVMRQAVPPSSKASTNIPGEDRKEKQRRKRGYGKSKLGPKMLAEIFAVQKPLDAKIQKGDESRIDQQS